MQAQADVTVAPNEAAPETALAAASLSLIAHPGHCRSMSIAPVEPCSAASAPWSAYWWARLNADRPAADTRELLDAAYHAFCARQHDQRTGALLCAAAAIETFYLDEGPLDPMDGWIERLLQWLPDGGPWPTPELEAQVMACGIGIVLRDQSHPLLAPWALRGAVLVRQMAPGAARVKLATFLLQYHLWRGEFGKTGLIVDALPGLDVDGLLPHEALAWHQSVATHARYTSQHERGRRAIDTALRLAEDQQLSQHLYALHAHGASLALAAHNAEAAERHLQAMRPVLDGLPQGDQTHYWHFHAGLCVLRGETTQAIEYARMTLANSLEIGGPYRTATHLLSLGLAHLAAGDAEAAQAPLQSAIETARGIEAALLEFSAGLALSAALSAMPAMSCARTRLSTQGGAPSHQFDQADAALRTAMALGAAGDFRTTAGWWLPEVMARTIAQALRRGVQPEFARRFARITGLRCPDAALEAWPWALRLYGFGELSVLRDDAPLFTDSTRAQQRPLDLLRALLASDGAPLAVSTALEWLWPGTDRDAQRKAFDAALLRLRRLLGDDSLLRLEGGQLLLDRSRVWSDVSALGACLAQSRTEQDTATLQRMAEELVCLASKPFLGDLHTLWADTARARYRRRYVMAISQIAEALERSDAARAVQLAVQLYERALDVDPLAESLHRRLMRLHARRGDRAELLRSWQHCRQMLAQADELPLSPETLALARELGLAASPLPTP